MKPEILQTLNSIEEIIIETINLKKNIIQNTKNINEAIILLKEKYPDYISDIDSKFQTICNNHNFSPINILHKTPSFKNKSV